MLKGRKIFVVKSDEPQESASLDLDTTTTEPARVYISEGWIEIDPTPERSG